MMKAGLKPVIGVLIALSVQQAMAVDLLQEAERQLAAGNGKAALAVLERHESTAADRIQERLLHATALAQSGQTRRAEQAFQALIDEFPNRPEPYNNLAALYAAQGKLGEAKEVLERALHTDPSYAAVYTNLSAIYQEMARNSYVKALRIEGERGGPNLQVLYRLPTETHAVAATVPAMPAPKPADPLVPLVVAKADAPSLAPQVAIVSPAPAEAAPVEPPAKVNPPAVRAAVAPPPSVAPAAPAKTVEVSSPATKQTDNVAPVIDPADPAVAGPKSEVEGTLFAWAEAWSRQDAEAYLNYYAADFRPSSGQGREQWAAERRKRLTRAESIQVKLTDLRLTMRGPNRAQLDVIQDYHSPRYQDRTRKRFLLTREDGRWLIRSEKSLELLR